MGQAKRWHDLQSDGNPLSALYNRNITHIRDSCFNQHTIFACTPKGVHLRFGDICSFRAVNDVFLNIYYVNIGRELSTFPYFTSVKEAMFSSAF